MTEGPRAALSPLGSAVIFGLILFKVVQDPPKPTPWTRARVVVTAVLFGTSGLALIIAMVWVLTVRSEAPIRVVAVIGILSVPALGIWLVRTARSQDRAARNRQADS